MGNRFSAIGTPVFNSDIDRSSLKMERFKRSDTLISPFQSTHTRIVKRAFDVMVALCALVVFAPVLLVIALSIYLRDRGQVFFIHTRVGQDGVEFGCMKFRTMVIDAEERLEELLANNPRERAVWEVRQKLDDDPRIIPGIGHFLRKSSLDELPQLLNILFGHMSVIGPRPVTKKELHHYGPMLKYYFAVKPGLTGPWQIGGRSDVGYAERVQLDANYARYGNLKTDIGIFFKTVRGFVTGKLTGAS